MLLYYARTHGANPIICDMFTGEIQVLFNDGRSYTVAVESKDNIIRQADPLVVLENGRMGVINNPRVEHDAVVVNNTDLVPKKCAAIEYEKDAEVGYG